VEALLGTDRAPAVIQGPGELAVVVAEQEPEAGLLIKRAKQIPGLLGDPVAGGVDGATSEVDSSGVQLNEAQDIQPLQQQVSTVRKAQARMPAAWRRRNDRQAVEVVVAPAGARWRAGPWR
jgi:hypothetical protein